MPGRLPSSTKKLDASKPKRAPITALTSSSTTSASIAPLGLVAAPTGSIDPASAAWASVVGWPSASSAQPGGMASPFLAATITLPRATSLRLRSTISGSAPRRGNTAATGLVPKIGCLPPAAGMAAGELAKPSPTMPAAATARRWSTTTPQWWLRTTPAIATPCCSAAAIASATARSQAGKARPPSASTTRAPPWRCNTRGSAAPLARPLRRWVQYCATRLSPCEPRPCDSASTSAWAVASAMPAPAPARCNWADTSARICAKGNLMPGPPATCRRSGC